MMSPRPPACPKKPAKNLESNRPADCISKGMKTTHPETFESTYALIVRSEEKQRSRFELLIYALLIASAMFAISQFGHQAATMPLGIASHAIL